MQIGQLETLLTHLRNGEWSDAQVLSMLSLIWGDLAGSDTKMFEYKLERAERLRFVDPCLTFQIERHGGTARGSSYATVQEWVVDLETGTKLASDSGKRRIGGQELRFDARSAAEQFLTRILAHDPHVVVVMKNGGLKVDLKALVPIAKVPATNTSRLKRLRRELNVLLRDHGMYIDEHNRIIERLISEG